jgi:hypothetical protein
MTRQDCLPKAEGATVWLLMNFIYKNSHMIMPNFAEFCYISASMQACAGSGQGVNKNSQVKNDGLSSVLQGAR